jgi:hypothetical protein
MNTHPTLASSSKIPLLLLEEAQERKVSQRALARKNFSLQ